MRDTGEEIAKWTESYAWAAWALVGIAVVTTVFTLFGWRHARRESKRERKWRQQDLLDELLKEFSGKRLTRARKEIDAHPRDELAEIVRRLFDPDRATRLAADPQAAGRQEDTAERQKDHKMYGFLAQIGDFMERLGGLSERRVIPIEDFDRPPLGNLVIRYWDQFNPAIEIMQDAAQQRHPELGPQVWVLFERLNRDLEDLRASRDLVMNDISAWKRVLMQIRNVVVKVILVPFKLVITPIWLGYMWFGTTHAIWSRSSDGTPFALPNTPEFQTKQGTAGICDRASGILKCICEECARRGGELVLVEDRDTGRKQYFCAGAGGGIYLGGFSCAIREYPRLLWPSHGWI